MTTIEALQTRLLHELEPVVAANVDRHLGLAKSWEPHDYVPWSRGTRLRVPGRRRLDARGLTARSGRADRTDRQPAHRGQTCPPTTREIATRFGRDGAWGHWVGRWTAEEGRHAIAIRDYLVVTRAVDPGQARGVAHGANDRRLRLGRQDDAAGRRLRLVPGTGHPGVAPQYRPSRG